MVRYIGGPPLTNYMDLKDCYSRLFAQGLLRNVENVKQSEKLRIRKEYLSPKYIEIRNIFQLVEF